MAVLIVVLDEGHHEWHGPPDMKGVYHVKLDLEKLELTEAEIELHATTLVKMLLTAIQETKVTSSCGCVFCDIEVDLHEDDQGFHHIGHDGKRIACKRKIR